MDRRLESLRHYESQKQSKLKEAQANRYSQFREQFDDIFEVTLTKKKEKDVN